MKIHQKKHQSSRQKIKNINVDNQDRISSKNSRQLNEDMTHRHDKSNDSSNHQDVNKTNSLQIQVHDSTRKLDHRSSSNEKNRFTRLFL